MKLEQLLHDKKCFKLICGAGNQDIEEISRLVAIYSAAGCKFFDFAADTDVLKAAHKGLDFSITKQEQENYHFCISIGTKGDKHIKKARINQEKCRRCEQCKITCPQSAISQYLKVKKEKCIGCHKCFEVCKHRAIEMYSDVEPFDYTIFKNFKIACIELHASDVDEAEVDELWQYLNKNYDGLLSLCIGREKLIDEQVLSRVKKLVSPRKEYTTIIQADGNAISGGADDFESTRAAIETGKLIQSLNLPIFLLLSGGTNSKTSQLAHIQNLDIQGVGIGSFARKIVKEFIKKEVFWTDKNNFEQAVKVAKDLIKSINNP